MRSFCVIASVTRCRASSYGIPKLCELRCKRRIHLGLELAGLLFEQRCTALLKGGISLFLKRFLCRLMDYPEPHQGCADGNERNQTRPDGDHNCNRGEEVTGIVSLIVSRPLLCP